MTTKTSSERPAGIARKSDDGIRAILAASCAEEAAQGGGAISHKVYMAMLEARANDGDKEAQKTLSGIRKRAAILSPEEKRRKDLDFFKFRQQYLKDKGYYDDKKNIQPQNEADNGAQHP